MGLSLAVTDITNPLCMIGWVIAIIVLIVLLVILRFLPVGLWIKARNSGFKVGMIDLIGMRLRRTPPAKIVLPYIRAIQAGLSLDVRQLESHYLVEGNVERVVDAMIEAERIGSPLPFERAAAIDLAGRDVLEAVYANDL